jgi:predicted RNase H-like HicB family nuclease
MLIQWDEEDGIFMVTLPEFDNALTHGSTYKDAVKQGQDLIESFIMWHSQDGKPLPKPELFDYDKAVAARSGELAEAR